MADIILDHAQYGLAVLPFVFAALWYSAAKKHKSFDGSGRIPDIQFWYGQTQLRAAAFIVSLLGVAYLIMNA